MNELRSDVEARVVGRQLDFGEVSGQDLSNVCVGESALGAHGLSVHSDLSLRRSSSAMFSKIGLFIWREKRRTTNL